MRFNLLRRWQWQIANRTQPRGGAQMLASWLRYVLSRQTRPSSRPPNHSARRSFFRPGLEALEDRLVPSFSAAAGPLVAVEGKTFSGVVGYTTAGFLDLAPTAVNIDWGDGHQSAATLVFTRSTFGTFRTDYYNVVGTHTYAEEVGTTITLTGTYSDGSSAGTLYDHIEVSDAPLSITGNNLSLTAGAPFSGAVASFRDAGSRGAVSDYNATIEWGDDGLSAGTVLYTGSGNFAVVGDHTYRAPGDYSLTVQIADAGGSTAQAAMVLPVWAPVTSMSTGREGLAAVAGTDGSIYAIGGADETTFGLASVQRFDPARATWTAVQDMAVGRVDPAAVTAGDGSVYVFGGSNRNGLVPAISRYVPASNSWSDTGNLLTERFGPAAVMDRNGLIYVLGGLDSSDTVLSTVERYDPATNTVTYVASMPTARWNFAAALGADGAIYAIGGLTTSDDTRPAISSVERYDPALDRWTTVASMASPRSAFAAVSAGDGSIYALGGYSAGSLMASVERYDPNTNTWAPAASMGTARSSFAAAISGDGRLYALGGLTASGLTSSVEAGNTGLAVHVTQAAASRLVVTSFPPTIAGTPGAFTVTAVDPYGETVPSYTGTVSFYATGQASLPAATTLTDGTGTFTATLFTAGLQSLAASDGTISGQEDDIVVVAAAPATITVVDTPQSTTVNTSFAQALQALVFDAYDNAVPGVSVAFTASSTGAGGTFPGFEGPAFGTSVTTDSDGVATAPMLTANRVAGNFTATASVAGATPATFTLTNLPGAPAALAAVTGTSQSTRLNQHFATPLRAFVTDGYGNQVSGAGVSVTFTVAPDNGSGGSGASGTFAGGGATATVSTDAGGMAAAPALTANNRPGRFTVSVSASGLTPDSFQLTNIGDPATLALAPNSPQSAKVGQLYLFPLQAQVTDKNGNPVPGVRVTFTAPTRGASGTFAMNGSPVASVAVMTNSSGVAMAPSFTANTTAGAFRVTVAATGIPSANFSLTNLAGAAARIAAIAGTRQSSSTGNVYSAPFKVRVTDAFGNALGDASVTFSAGPQEAGGVSPSVSAVSAVPACGLFTGGLATVVVHTGEHGVASAPTFTANDSAGSFTVSASLAGMPDIKAIFHLTNKARSGRSGRKA